MSGSAATVVVPAPPASAVPGLAALAFGSASGIQGGAGKHLAFLPLEALELDLSDPEQRDFGDYELIEQLGQGGMGVVYRARQKSLQREVALKLLAAGPWASPDYIARFRREAQSAARLQHSNIVPIYEIGAHAELNFFSMALVRGQNLAQTLHQGPGLASRDAARMMRTIAETLDYAHRLGILHLDLKPANILIDEHGEPQVADFGLAKRLEETLSSDSDEVSGTPSYMAPEQAQVKSHRLSVATDIYGLGAILYELLCRRPPFLGATARDTLAQVIHHEVAPPHVLDPSIPADLSAICLKCLAKEPKQRYLTARGLAEDLGRFLDGRAVSVRPLTRWQALQRWVRREPKVAFAALLAVFALVTGLVATSMQWRRAEISAAQARGNLWVARAQAAQEALAQGDGFSGLRPLIANLDEMAAHGHSADVAIERQRIGAMLANAPQMVDLIRLPQGVSITALAISPDGQHYAIGTHDSGGERRISYHELATHRELWSTLTDNLTRGLPFASATPHGHLHFTADGRRLVARLTQMPVFAAPQGSDTIALDVHDGRVLAPADRPEGYADQVFSADARFALLRFRSHPSLRFPDIVQFYATEPWQALGPRLGPDENGDNIEWLPAPDGRWLLGTSDFNRLTLYQPAKLTPIWHLQLPNGARARAWRFNADASLLALGTASGTVHLVDTADGRQIELQSAPVALVTWLEFSNDGRSIAAAASDGSIMAWDIATRRPRMAPVAAGTTERSRVLLVGDNLHSAAGTELHSWAVPALGPFENVAIPAAARLRNRRHLSAHAFDVHDQGRTLISGGTDGTLAVWRMPTSALLPVGAAPLQPRLQGFDGNHVVSVDGAAVQVRDARNAMPRSPVWRHPDPVRWAELTLDGTRLVTLAHRSVRILDPTSGELLSEPILLPQTPLRADLSQSGTMMALTTGEYIGDTFHERIHAIDLVQGTLRTLDPPIPGPLGDFNLDPAGRFVMLHRHWMSKPEFIELQLLALNGSAHGCPGLALGSSETPWNTAIVADGRSAWTYLALPKRRGALLHWDLERCTEIRRVDVQQSTVMPQLIVGDDHLYAHRLTGKRLSLFDTHGQRQELPGVSSGNPVAEFAVSADQRRAALATRNAVQLIDLERGEYLSSLLPAPIPGNDNITRLAFSPDASSLLGRTIKGRWLLWQLPATAASTQELTQLARVVAPEGDDAPLSDAEFALLQQRLRSAGQLPVTTLDPSFERTINLQPAPDSEGDPRFLPLDLSPISNVPLNGDWPPMPATGGDRPTLAPGRQRLNGIDWLMEGGVQLSRGGAATSIHPNEPTSSVLSIAQVRARRIHALMHMHIPIRAGMPPRSFASVVMIGADGRETRLPIEVVRDVVTHSMPHLAAPSARIGWAGVSGVDLRYESSNGAVFGSFAFIASLDLPANTGVITGLRLEAADGQMEAPLFHALTLELDTHEIALPAMARPDDDH